MTNLSWSHEHKWRPMRQCKMNGPRGKYTLKTHASVIHLIEHSEFLFKVIFWTQTKLPLDHKWSGDVPHHTNPQTMINVLFNMSGFRPNQCKKGDPWPTHSSLLSLLNEFNPLLQLYLTMILKPAQGAHWHSLCLCIDYWFSLFHAQVNESF